MRYLLTTISLAWFIVAGVFLVHARGDVLYGIDFDTGNLYTINPNTGAPTLVGNPGVNMFPFGLADRGTKLFAYDQVADRIREISPVDGAIVSTIDVGIDVGGEGSITFRSDGVGFLTQTDGPLGTLFTFDIVAETSTIVGAEDGLLPSMDGLDFDGSDVLFGKSQSNTTSSLYTVNQGDATTSFVGTVGGPEGIDTVSALTFRGDGTLWADVGGSLVTVDPNTGDILSTIGEITGVKISGMTWLVPEPPAATLAAAGLVILLTYGWRRTRRGGHRVSQ